jgi:hypothetical protein
MKTNFQALCEELVQIADALVGATPTVANQGQPLDGFSALANFTGLADRARVALAAEVVGEGVTDEEAQQLFDSLRTPIYGRLTTDTQDRVVGYEPVRPGDFARVVLSRYGHQPAPPAEIDCPACEGVPKPGNQPCAVCGRSALSAEGEVAELAWWLRSLEDASVWFESGSPEALKLTRAADLLEQRHPTPVPVSERPWEREGWCDDEDRCWCMSSLDGPPPRWWLVRPEPLSDGFVLPATALPVPQGEPQP